MPLSRRGGDPKMASVSVLLLGLKYVKSQKAAPPSVRLGERRAPRLRRGAIFTKQSSLIMSAEGQDTPNMVSINLGTAGNSDSQAPPPPTDSTSRGVALRKAQLFGCCWCSLVSENHCVRRKWPQMPVCLFSWDWLKECCSCCFCNIT